MAVWDAEDPDGFEEEFADCEKETGEVVVANIVLCVSAQREARLVKLS